MLIIYLHFQTKKNFAFPLFLEKKPRVFHSMFEATILLNNSISSSSVSMNNLSSNGMTPSLEVLTFSLGYTLLLNNASTQLLNTNEINQLFNIHTGGWGVPEYDAHLNLKKKKTTPATSASTPSITTSNYGVGVSSKNGKRQVQWLNRRIHQRCLLRVVHHWSSRSNRASSCEDGEKGNDDNAQKNNDKMLMFIHELSNTSLRLTPKSTLPYNTASTNIRIEMCIVLSKLLSRTNTSLSSPRPSIEDRWSWFEMCMDWQDCYATTNQSLATSKKKSTAAATTTTTIYDSKNENILFKEFHGTFNNNSNSNELSNVCRHCMCTLLYGEAFSTNERNEFVWSWIDALFQCGQRTIGTYAINILYNRCCKCIFI
jgi:hypothetical protein